MRLSAFIRHLKRDAISITMIKLYARLNIPIEGTTFLYGRQHPKIKGSVPNRGQGGKGGAASTPFFCTSSQRTDKSNGANFSVIGPSRSEEISDSAKCPFPRIVRFRQLVFTRAVRTPLWLLAPKFYGLWFYGLKNLWSMSSQNLRKERRSRKKKRKIKLFAFQLCQRDHGITPCR